MTDEKELDKLFEYGSKLLDSIEQDYWSGCKRAEDLEAERDKEKEKYRELAGNLEDLLEKTKARGGGYGRE